MRTMTFRFHTEIDGIRQVLPIEARNITEAKRLLTAALWPGERPLF